MDELLRRRVDDIARAGGFSGAVRVDDVSGIRVEAAYGLADRRHGIANTVDTRFALASGMKGLTALTVMSLVESGLLTLDTPVRELLGQDLLLVDDRVTVEHLLAHRAGIGDYFDESAHESVDDYVLTVPVHSLVDTQDYLTILDGRPQVFAPGERFAYCNGGFVVLALVAERAGGKAFHELVTERVLVPSAMAATGFLRSDELPGDAAIGYLEPVGLKTNALHLPVRGSGDGGVYSTLDDVAKLWRALFSGTIVSTDAVSQMTRPHSMGASKGMNYGLGFWLGATDATVILEGYDAGVSFRTRHDPQSGRGYTVISNTSSGAWALADRLDELASA